MSFWDEVIITASSERQAGLYREEIRRRQMGGSLPSEIPFLVVPDPGDQRIGSGTATINALGILNKDREWWESHRVLLIHSGGDSRRFPQYSPVGKLFGVLPSRLHPRATTTVFDETMALSKRWAECVSNGMLVASGDVVLRFDANQVAWNRPGVTGIAMCLDAEIGGHHGVYVIGEADQVYTFLQKPQASEIRAAGGFRPDGRVAVDSGLLRFDPNLTVALAELAKMRELPHLDLYDQITRTLTGQMKLDTEDSPFWIELSRILRSPDCPVAFHCSVVDGEFIHAGTTSSFRSLASGSGGFLDSVVSGRYEIGHEAVILECDLKGPVEAGRGAILHGLTGINGLIEIPENTVVHQLPVDVSGGSRWVIRAYGVEDDPKQYLPHATWFNRPIMEIFARLGFSSDDVWATEQDRSLWNAALFPATSSVDDAWNSARWLMGLSSSYTLSQWRKSVRMSLAESAQYTDAKALSEARNRRSQGIWRETAIELAESGADLRPLLANLPGLAPAAEAGRSLRQRAERLRHVGADVLTSAASRFVQAARLLESAGFENEASAAEDEAFKCIQQAVHQGVESRIDALPVKWKFESVSVSAPPRFDLGGGWSDTPPFCFDWGGTVLNCAIEIDGDYPIETNVVRIDKPAIRCIVGSGEFVEYQSADQLLEPCRPGSVFSIPRAALQLYGLPVKGQRLDETLSALGGGIEIRSRVRLPIGSGLGTSSILSATIIRALAAISGLALSDHELSKVVMQLEQRITTGGGWQDQAGGIFPGAKLLLTGPGLQQRIRVQPVQWTELRKQEFCQHMVLYDTGIQRMAKDLLRQVVLRYLARESATIQVLHSIKTLAVEMSYALAEGDWQHLGELLDRHWQLNQVIDTNTTNAPINTILGRAKPYIYGAKLAGAGGGGFLMMLARDPDAALGLKQELSRYSGGRGKVIRYKIAEDGLRVQIGRQRSDSTVLARTSKD